jgi:chitin synthase
VYGILAIYLLVCSIWLTVESFIGLPATLVGKSAGQIAASFFSSPVGALIAAMISTFGAPRRVIKCTSADPYSPQAFTLLLRSSMYVSLNTSSISLTLPMQRDPWHMFSSFLQYLCLAPSFTNVLNVYAFCNLHDVSWGTKGSDKVDALPSVSSSKNKSAAPVVVDTTKPQEDVDAAFKETVTRALTKVNVKEVREKPTLDDQNKTFRTRLVAFWMLTNAGLAVAIENINGLPDPNFQREEAALRQKQNIYFSVILYATFALSAIRFLGCLFYFLKRNLFRCCRRN